MKTSIVAAILALVAVSAHAGGGFASPQQAQGQGQGQLQGQAQAAISQGGAGGSVAEGAVDISTSNNYRERREAPSVWVTAPNSTADYMVCFGLGGSTNRGAATGILCRIQKELYAEHRAEQLAYLGAYEEAAAAYCSRKLHWKDFGTQVNCKTRYTTVLRASFPQPEQMTIEGVILKH